MSAQPDGRNETSEEVVEAPRPWPGTWTPLGATADDEGTNIALWADEAERVDMAIHRTMDRVDDTADRVRSTVRAKTSWVVGTIRGLRVALEGILRNDPRDEPTRGGPGRIAMNFCPSSIKIPGALPFGLDSTSLPSIT